MSTLFLLLECLFSFIFLAFYLHFTRCLDLGLVFAGVDHEFGTDVLVKVFFADDLELEGGLLEREALFVRVLCRFAGGIVADDGVEAGYQHQTRRMS